MALLLAIACSSYHLAVRPIAPVGVASRRVVSVVGCDREPGQLGGIPPPARDQDEEEEYLSALAEARRASAKLQEAESRLRQAAERRPAAPSETAPPVAAPAAKPAGARTSVSRSDAGTLLVEVPPDPNPNPNPYPNPDDHPNPNPNEVPPAGLLNMGTLMGGAFSAAWFSAVVPATGSMIATGGASALFMLPFWLAGGVVAKQTVVDPVKATSLSIGEFAWELQQTAVGLPLKSFSGASEELDGCRVEVAAYVNGVPQHVLRLFAGTQAWSIGDGLTVVELEYIAAEVNAHLATLKK